MLKGEKFDLKIIKKKVRYLFIIMFIDVYFPLFSIVLIQIIKNKVFFYYNL